MQTSLGSYPVRIETPVAWGEMDAFQHVNNIVYFRYFESARIAYFEKIGFLELMETSGIGPILASTSCRFKLPLSYPDQVTAGARVAEIMEDRFLMRYAVFSHKHGRIAAEGEGLMVCFNYQDNRKTAIPPDLAARIRELEAATGESAV